MSKCEIENNELKSKLNELINSTSNKVQSLVSNVRMQSRFRKHETLAALDAL